MSEGEGLLGGKSALLDLDKEITCGVCHEHYSDPKVLHCFHYYCKQCLHQLILSEKPFSCPECGKDTTLHEGDLDKLPTPLVVNRMMEIHSKLEHAHSKMEAKCEMKIEEFRRVAVAEVETMKVEVKEFGQSMTDHIEGLFGEVHQELHQKIVENRKQEILEENASSMQKMLKHLSEQEEGLSTGIYVDAKKTRISGRGLKTAQVQKAAQCMLRTKLSNGKPTKRAFVKGSLKSLATDSTIRCVVKLIEGNKYHLQYTPTIRGRHELIVTVNGQEVAGSPFPVFVSISPTLLGKPVQVITGIEEPMLAAVSATGNLIVTGSGSVTIFDRKGGKLKELDLLKYNITGASGVAVDNTDGSIYISDVNRIIKLNPAYELIGEFPVALDEEDEDMSEYDESEFVQVRVVGDEVMVREVTNKTIMAFTKDLKFVRQFDYCGDDSGHISDVYWDEHCNMYVSDWEKSFVRVFNKSGELLRSIRHNGGELNGPHCVCVFGRYVYVTDDIRHRVFVFTTEGESITWFGQYGGSEGNFIAPWGMCIDVDGFVYVCDFLNHRVQKF